MTRRSLALLVAVCLSVAACADDRSDVGTVTTTTASSGGGASSTSTSSAARAQGDLPGERVEIYPNQGAQLAVVGVEVGDTLNVRSGPGVAFDVVFELEPLATGITATGHNRSLGEEGFWAEVRAEGATGWATVVYLSHLGKTTDITGEVVDDGRPSAASMHDLGLAVAQERASSEPPSRIVVVDGPSQGDVAEITLDVIGLGDDSVGGERLHIFAEEGSGDQRFTLRTVEMTVLCTRGVSDGLCV